MTSLITWLMGEAGGWIAAAVAGLITLAGVYLRGRADGKANELRKADKAYRETREKMDAVDTGDDAGALREWLRERGERPGDL